MRLFPIPQPTENTIFVTHRLSAANAKSRLSGSNVMAIYRYTNSTGASLKLSERPLYGSSRLGSLRTPLELHSLAPYSPAAANPVQPIDLTYELTDHLGNVCAVVTGRLLDGNGGGTPKQPELLSAQGYEAGGSLLPGRNYSSDSYRYGLNGQEKDDEIYGSTGTSYTAEFWQYDPRIARRWNIDPVIKEWESPYAAFANNPIFLIDPNGANATKYVDECNVELACTNDGNDATVTIADQHLDAFKKELSQAPVDKNAPSNNAKWIADYSAGMTFEQGANVADWAIDAIAPGQSKASLYLATAGLGAEGGKMAAGKTTFRLFNQRGSNFSPKFYSSGWQGGSAGKITTYGLGKTIGLGGKALGLYGVGNSVYGLATGEVSLTKGTADIIMGLVGTYGGWKGALLGLSYECGKLFGPSKWYGEDDSKWFE
jgi:hypothetical protein